MMKIRKAVLNEFTVSPVQFTSLNSVLFRNVKPVYDNSEIYLEYEHQCKVSHKTIVSQSQVKSLSKHSVLFFPRSPCPSGTGSAYFLMAGLPFSNTSHSNGCHVPRLAEVQNRTKRTTDRRSGGALLSIQSII